MDFTQHREGFSEEDDEMMSDKGKHPFSYSSSSSSYDQMSLGPMSSWLGSNSHHNNSGDGTTKLEIMESTTVSQDQSDDNNNNNSNASCPPPNFATIEKEHMFEKVVTPSDVGKLNRLVIPKQHAEKYFPLDASTNEKGLLLNFEDSNGKPWRFRYSYWNSSQSYVMTKGWSRFVKDKKLDAGDIVSFQRGVGELGKDRLFIDWRRRPDGLPPNHHNHHHQPTSLPNFGLSHSHQYPIHRSIPWSPLFVRPPGPGMAAASLHSSSHFNSINNVNMYPYRSSNAYGGASSTNLYSQGNNVFYIRPALPAFQWQQGGGSGDGGAPVEPMVFDSVPVVQGKAAAKRLRLFGVNMDCPISDDHDHDHDVLLSNTIQHQAPQLSSYSNSSLQLRLYNGTPLQADFQDKTKPPSSSSLDLDM